MLHTTARGIDTRRPSLRPVFVGLLSLFALLAGPFDLLRPTARAAGTTWHVSPGGAGACTPADPNCASIQSAVGAASADDTIQAAAGTYPERVPSERG